MEEWIAKLAQEFQKLPPEGVLLVLAALFALGYLLSPSPSKKLVRAINAANRGLLERLDGFEAQLTSVRTRAEGVFHAFQNYKPVVQLSDGHIRQIADLSLKFDPGLRQQILALGPIFDALKELQHDHNDDPRDFNELIEWVDNANQAAILLNRFQPPQGMPIEAIAGELEQLDKAIGKLNDLRWDHNDDQRDFDDIRGWVDDAMGVANALNKLQGTSPEVAEKASRTLTALELAIKSIEALKHNDDGDERDFDEVEELLDKVEGLAKVLKRVAQAA